MLPNYSTPQNSGALRPADCSQQDFLSGDIQEQNPDIIMGWQSRRSQGEQKYVFPTPDPSRPWSDDQPLLPS